MLISTYLSDGGELLAVLREGQLCHGTPVEAPVCQYTMRDRVHSGSDRSLHGALAQFTHFL